MLAVVRDGNGGERGGAVGAVGVGIEEHAGGLVELAGDIEDVLRLEAIVAGVEVVTAFLPGMPNFS